jgi:hypothetical protein
MLHLNKDLVSRKEYAAACTVANRARHWLTEKCLPSPLKRGTYLVPIGMVLMVEEKLLEVEQRFLAKVEEFLAAYPDLVEKAKKDLDNQFVAASYPSVAQLRRSFSIERRLLDFGVPSEAKIGLAMFKHEKDRAEATWRSAADEIQVALREAFRSLVGHLAEQLEPAVDGSKKVLKDRAIDKVLEFIDLFKDRNITGDVELEGLVIQARNVLKGKRADKIRKNSTVRGEVVGEMARVQVALDKLLENAPRRKIVLEDE